MPKRSSPEIENEAVKLYADQRLSPNKIAKLLPISASTVKSIMKRKGIKLRTISEGRRIYFCNSDYFKVIDSAIKAQIYGFIAADGYIRINPKDGAKNLSINLAFKDRNYLEFIKEQMEYTGNIIDQDAYVSEKYGEVGILSNLTISDPILVNDLINLGITPRKSLTLKFPTKEQLPDEFLSDYIRGLFQGDGSIGCYARKKSKVLATTVKICVTKELGESIKQILREKLNINCYVFQNTKYKKMENSPNVWELMVGGNNQIEKFLDWIYTNDIYNTMPRKYDRYIYFKKFRNLGMNESYPAVK